MSPQKPAIKALGSGLDAAPAKGNPGSGFSQRVLPLAGRESGTVPCAVPDLPPTGGDL